MTNPLDCMLNEEVVLDTESSIVYIGTLTEHTDHLFVLTQADLHDCRDGHASKEAYLAAVKRDGITANRDSVIVMRRVVMSVSPLSAIIAE